MYNNNDGKCPIGEEVVIMAVKVRGKNIEVTQALKDYVEKRVQTITKQFKTVGEITAVMRVEKGKHIVPLNYRLTHIP